MDVSPRKPGALPKPCPSALASFGVSAKRWTTRADVYGLLDQAREFLDTAPNGTCVADAARVANLSPYHFAHRFQELYGVAPSTYHRDALMKRATELLLKMSVSEAAVVLGFDSASAFGRAFKRKHTISPGAYRNHVRLETG